MRKSAFAITLFCVFLSSCLRSPEEKSAAFVKSGKAYLDKKEYATAVIELRNAVSAAPKNAEAHYLLGLALQKTGGVARAVPEFKVAADLDPSNADVRLRLAEILGSEEDSKMVSIAEAYAQAALKLRPGDPDALSALAMAEFRQNKIEPARQHLKAALQKNPAHPKASATLAQIQWTVDKDVPAAEKTFRSAVERSNDPDALIALGRFYSALGRPAEAEAELRKALAGNPNQGVALLELAKVQRSSGKTADALSTLEKLSSLPDPEYRAYHAQFLFQNGQKDAAIQELKDKLQKEPDQSAIQSALVGFYLETNRIDEADRLLAAAAAKDPRNAEVHEQRAQLLLAQKRIDEAGKAAEEAIRLRPQSGRAHYWLAKVHQARNRPLEYRNELKLAADFDPGLVPAFVDLAESLRNSKSLVEALAVLDRLTPGLREQQSVLVERGWVLLALGRLSDAKGVTQKALAGGRTSSVLLQAGLVEIAEKRHEQGRALLEESLKLSPDNVEALNALAGSLAGEKRVPAAVERIRRQAALAPKSAPVQFTLGAWLERTGDLGAARAAYAAALSNDAAYPPAIVANARMEMMQGQWSQAKKRAETLLAKDRTNVDARLALAMAEEGAGNREAAIKAYREVVQADASNLTALNNLVMLLAENPGTTDEAVMLARQLKGVAPNNLQVDDTVGWAYYKKGNYPLAIEFLERAARATEVQPKYHLAMAYFSAGRKDLGQRVLSAALQIDPNVPEAKAAQSLAASSK